jgi:hypothetical protein
VGHPHLSLAAAGRAGILSAVGVGTPILFDLILSGDQDALAGYYDGRAPSVYAYCHEVCNGEQVEEAVLASFADFLGRLRAAGSEADLDDLLRKSTRTAAASRMRVAKGRDATCRSMPELIAARANGELPHGDGPINAHLEHCRSCRQAAQRLVEAEDALVGSASRQPPEEVRTAWLLIAAKDTKAATSAPDSEVGEAPVAEEPAAEAPSVEPGPSAPAPQPPAPDPEPPPPPPTPKPPAPAPDPEPPGPAPDPEPPAPAPDPEPPAPAPDPEPPAPAPDPEPPAPPPAPEPPPIPAPAAAAPEPRRIRRRSGGLIGAARRVARGR